MGLGRDGLPFVERRTGCREAREHYGQTVCHPAAVAAPLGHRLQLLDDQALLVLVSRDIARIVDRHDAPVVPEQRTEPLSDGGGRTLDLNDERTVSALEAHPLAGESLPEGQLCKDIVQPHPYSPLSDGESAITIVSSGRRKTEVGDSTSSAVAVVRAGRRDRAHDGPAQWVRRPLAGRGGPELHTLGADEVQCSQRENSRS